MAATEQRESARTAVVWDVLEPLLSGEVLDVLDIGGGTGGSAVRIAEAGHRVVVVDPSPDALAALENRARERGVEVDGRQGDVAGLAEVVAPASADLVLCHGVLEMVDPVEALARIREVLRPEGTVSLLMAQRHASVVAKALAGHLHDALDLLDEGEAGPTGHRYTLDEATGLLDGAGFEVLEVHAIRVFADLVPGSVLDLEPGSAATLIELERRVSTRPEYLSLATQLHLLAR
jgi:SAM-dependent methyltransferase